MLSRSLHFTSLHYMSYICENCSTFLLGGFLGPSELFAYWRPASFIIKVSWIKVLFLNVSYILKTNKGLWCISTFIFLWLPGKDCSNAGAKMLSLLHHPYPPSFPLSVKKTIYSVFTAALLTLLICSLFFWRPFLLFGRTTETCFVHITEWFFPWLVAFSVLFPTWLSSVAFNKCLEKKCSLVRSSTFSSTGSGLEDFLTGSLSPSRSHAQRRTWLRWTSPFYLSLPSAVWIFWPPTFFSAGFPSWPLLWTVSLKAWMFSSKLVLSSADFFWCDVTKML